MPIRHFLPAGIFFVTCGHAALADQFRDVITKYNPEVQIAQDVYNEISEPLKYADGWKRTRNWEDIINSSDRSPEMKNHIIQSGRDDGFFAAEYEKDGRKIIAFRGSSEKLDFIADSNQARGAKTTQYDLVAKELSKDISKMSNASCVGHSLGGGLSNLACGLAGKQSVTVNPAPLNSEHLSQIKDKKLITNLFIGDDLVHKIGYNQPGNSLHIVTTENNGKLYDASDFTLKDIGKAVSVGIKDGIKSGFDKSYKSSGFVGETVKSIVNAGIKGPHSVTTASEIFGVWNKEITKDNFLRSQANGAGLSNTQKSSESQSYLTKIYNTISQAVSEPPAKAGSPVNGPTRGSVTSSAGQSSGVNTRNVHPTFSGQNSGGAPSGNSALGVQSNWQPSTLTPAQLQAASNSGIKNAANSINFLQSTNSSSTSSPPSSGGANSGQVSSASKPSTSAGIPMQQISAQWMQTNGLKSGSGTALSTQAPFATNTGTPTAQSPSFGAKPTGSSGLQLQQSSSQWMQTNGLKPQATSIDVSRPNQQNVSGHGLGGGLTQKPIQTATASSQLPIRIERPSTPPPPAQPKSTMQIREIQQRVQYGQGPNRTQQPTVARATQPSYSAQAAQQRAYQQQQAYIRQQQINAQQQLSVPAYVPPAVSQAPSHRRLNINPGCRDAVTGRAVTEAEVLSNEGLYTMCVLTMPQDH